MELLSQEAFKKIIYHPDNKLLKTQAPNFFPKVVERDGNITRIFLKKKRLFTYDQIKPRALQFYTNAKQLVVLDVSAPRVLRFAQCKPLQAHLISYPKIPGIDVRTLLTDTFQEDLIVNVIDFLVKLHAKGIFFRSIHLGNLIYHDQCMHMIDIADVRFKSKPLSAILRYRNIKHLFLNKDDQAIWRNFSYQRVLELYQQKTYCNKFLQLLFRKLLKEKF